MNRTTRRILVPTLVFAASAALAGGIQFGAKSAREDGLHALLATPAIWWWLCARRDQVRVWRGAVAGVLVTFVAYCWPLLMMPVFYFYHPEVHDGGALDAVAIVILGGLAAISAPFGALLGMLVVRIQNLSEMRTKVRA